MLTIIDEYRSSFAYMNESMPKLRDWGKNFPANNPKVPCWIKERWTEAVVLCVNKACLQVGSQPANVNMGVAKRMLRK